MGGLELCFINSVRTGRVWDVCLCLGCGGMGGVGGCRGKWVGVSCATVWEGGVVLFMCVCVCCESRLFV